MTVTYVLQHCIVRKRRCNGNGYGEGNRPLTEVTAAAANPNTPLHVSRLPIRWSMRKQITGRMCRENR